MPRTYQTGFSVVAIGSDHADATIRKAEDWLHNHFPDDVDLDQLANDLSLTPRTFLRRFKAATGETPLAYLQRIRTDAARRMLEEDRLTIQEVGLAVGYEDVAFFRDLFKRHAGLAPAAYRERYGRSLEPSAA
jgi:transcriptional regulator GlxA family with amidase domain